MTKQEIESQIEEILRPLYPDVRVNIFRMSSSNLSVSVDCDIISSSFHSEKHFWDYWNVIYEAMEASELTKKKVYVTPLPVTPEMFEDRVRSPGEGE